MSRKAAGLDVAAALVFTLGGLVIWSISTSLSKADGPPPMRPADEATASASPADAPSQEVLDYGPVHEAFAQPTTLDPQPAMIVPTEAPPPVLETPPALRPKGDSVVWIPGYWAWEDRRRDFIWVSGIWRDPPPDHAWFAGYWAHVKGGYRWAPGIWAPANAEQVDYVPEPPKSSEGSPKSAAPAPNQFWIPGNYEYVDSRFAWRPGHWAAAQPGWIWTRARYEWTPRGHQFLKGHWDYELSKRGILFAPVAFKREHWAGRRIKYTPTVMVDAGSLTTDFFVRLSYYHYYFGDVYGPDWAGWGLLPWFDDSGGYDPIFVYYSWRRGTRDRDWVARLKERYAHMDRHPESRPMRLYVGPKGAGAQSEPGLEFPLEDFAKGAGAGNVQRVSADERNEYAEQAATSIEVAFQRASAEGYRGQQPGAGEPSPVAGARPQATSAFSPGDRAGARPSGSATGRDFAGTGRGAAAGTQRAGATTGPSRSAFRPWISALPATGTRANAGTVTTQAARQGTTPARTAVPEPKK